MVGREGDRATANAVAVTKIEHGSCDPLFFHRYRSHYNEVIKFCKMVKILLEYPTQIKNL